MKSEIFLARLLLDISGKNTRLIEQTGEHHPDIIMDVNGWRVNIEVTLIEGEDERFMKKTVHADDSVTTDKPKTQLTSQVLSKSKQFKRWIDKKVIQKSDVNIIAIDLGKLFPATPTGSLLDASLFTFSDKLTVSVNNENLPHILHVVPESKGVLTKKTYDGERENIEFTLDAVYDGLKNIDAIITFTKNAFNNDIAIVNVNNNKTVEYLYQRLRSIKEAKYQVSMTRWIMLWG